MTHQPDRLTAWDLVENYRRNLKLDSPEEQAVAKLIELLNEHHVLVDAECWRRTAPPVPSPNRALGS